MNNITVAGNVTKDGEMRFLPDSTPVLSFSVADNQGKDKDAIFWNCSLFGKRAETLNQYITKGQAVTVTGSIQQDKFNDKETGQPRTVLKIRVNDIALQGGKPDGGSSGKQSSTRPPTQNDYATAKGCEDRKPRSFDDFESDLPF